MNISIALLLFAWFAPCAGESTCTFWEPPPIHSLLFVGQAASLASLTFDSDIHLSMQEFLYLTNLRKGERVDAALLADGLRHLFAKKCFSHITLKADHTDDGVRLHYDLVGKWTVERVKVSGVWVGSDWYKQYYLMEPGDPFDQEKHQHSVQKMRDACYKDGFYNCTIETHCVPIPTTKSMQIELKIMHGARFCIGKNSLYLAAESSVNELERAMIDKQIYKKYIRPLRRKKYSKELVQEQARLIKKWLAHQGFLYSTIELHECIRRSHNEVELSWYIDIHKKRSFIFFGNRFFSDLQLLDSLLQFGSSAWMLSASILAQELISMYHKRGFWACSIETREEGERSFFVIKEGVRSHIEHVAVHGIDPMQERAVVRRFFGKVQQRGYVDQSLLDRSIDDLISHYVAHGFLDCQLVGTEYVPRQADGMYDLVVTIDQGACKVIDTVTVSGVGEFDLNEAFPRKEATPFNARELQRHKAWLMKQLHKDGYMYASARPTFLSDPDGKSILQWEVCPGEKILFGKTIIQGGSRLPTHYFLRELPYKEGDQWNQELVRNLFLRLKKLNIFDSVSLLPGQAVGSYRPLILKLHHDDPFELRMRAGLEFQHVAQYQTFGGLAYKVGSSLLVKNPSNHADLIKMDVNIARSHREFMMKYWYPWVAGLPVDGIAQGYSIKYEQPGFIGSSHNLYTIYQNGLLCGIRHTLPWIDCGLNVGFELSRMAINDDEAGNQERAQMIACAINFDPSLLDRRIPFVFVEPTIVLDFLDNNLNPHTGSFWLFTVKGMFPTDGTFRESFFVKLLAEQASFVSIADAVICAFRIRFGHIFHRQFCDIIPNERFYVGGAHSVRSYQADQAPPLGCFVDCDGKENLVPRGGKTMLTLNLEARIPIMKDIQAVLFQDMGVLSNDYFAEFRMDKMVAGTGFGFRYFTPVGPLRFDIAWKWKKQVPDESRVNWYLTFGQAF